MSFGYKLFHESINWYNSFNLNIIKNNFFFKDFHFFDFCLYVRNNSFNLSNLLSNDWNADLLDKRFNFYTLNFDFNNFFNCLRTLNNLLNISFNVNNLLNYSINWNWNFNWNDNLFFDLDYFANFMSYWYNFIDIYFTWNFYFVFDNLIICFFNNLNSADNLLNRYYFLNNFLNNILLCDISVDRNLNNFNSFFKHRDLNNLFNLNYVSVFDNSINNFFNDLWYFNYFLNNSWNDDNFFNDLLNFNNFRYFNHFFNDFVNVYSNLFYTFDNLRNLHYFFYCYFDWIVNCYLYCFNCFNLNDFWNFDNFFNIFLNFYDNRIFNFFNNNLSNDFRNSNNFLFNDWDLNSSINYFLNFPNNLDGICNDSFNLFYFFFVNNLLFNNFNFFYCWNFNLNFNDFLNYLWYFNNSFNCLNQRNRSFMDNFYDFRYSLNMVDNLSSILDFNLLD